MTEPDLTALAYECILQQANSSEPGEILADYFQRAYNLGVQLPVEEHIDYGLREREAFQKGFKRGLAEGRPKAEEEGGS